MKKVYLIGGTMGVGKTTLCQKLKKELSNAVFLDGDWCWDSDPFQVTEETKSMVKDNIAYVLNNFIHCSSYEHILFSWVMHEQSIIDEIILNLDLDEVECYPISLMVDKDTLVSRLQKDVEAKIRNEDVIKRSVQRIEMYETLNTIKLDTTNKSLDELVEEVKQLKIEEE